MFCHMSCPMTLKIGWLSRWIHSEVIACYMVCPMTFKITGFRIIFGGEWGGWGGIDDVCLPCSVVSCHMFCPMIFKISWLATESLWCDHFKSRIRSPDLAAKETLVFGPTQCSVYCSVIYWRVQEEVPRFHSHCVLWARRLFPRSIILWWLFVLVMLFMMSTVKCLAKTVKTGRFRKGVL